MVRSKRQAAAIILITVFLVALTRGLTISHNMELHSDEHVFFTAAQSLKGYLSGSSPVYEEVKEYPEGAIVFQLPFHILTAVINRLCSAGISPRLSGRIADVFYFTIGVALGGVIIYRFFSKKPVYTALYGLIAVFSLLHIEQSRYGTGDAISLFLLMSVVLLTASGLSAEKRRGVHVAFAVFAAGAAGAVKYPLVIFAAIPAFAAVRLMRGAPRGRKLAAAAAFLAVLWLGFAVFSPKAALDPMYIYRASTRELGDYLGAAGLPLYLKLWSNFMSIFTYSMLYSGFPLMPLWLFLALRAAFREKTGGNGVRVFFCRVMPVMLIVFFSYNLLATFFAMRSFYPFFFLGDLYVAAAAGNWLQRGGARRAAVLVLSAFMVLRGAWLVGAMSARNDGARMTALIESAVDDSWDKTTILSGYIIFPDGLEDEKETTVVNITDARFAGEDAMRLAPGELFIAGARDFAIGGFQYNFLPKKYSVFASSTAWRSFAAVNEEYCVGRLYPQYYYYLFGYWLSGTTGTVLEFPTCTVYYRA